MPASLLTMQDSFPVVDQTLPDRIGYLQRSFEMFHLLTYIYSLEQIPISRIYHSATTINTQQINFQVMFNYQIRNIQVRVAAGAGLPDNF